MRRYHKTSQILKYVKYLLIICLVMYCLSLTTDSIFYMFQSLDYYNSGYDTVVMFDLKNFVFDIYKISLILFFMFILFKGKSFNYSYKQFIVNLAKFLLFLPVCALLLFNLVVLNNLMNSFYLLVVFIVVNYIIDSFTNKVDKLYSVAVGSNIEVNEVVNKKVKEKKNARKSKVV